MSIDLQHEQHAWLGPGVMIDLIHLSDIDAYWFNHINHGMGIFRTADGQEGSARDSTKGID